MNKDDIIYALGMLFAGFLLVIAFVWLAYDFTHLKWLVES
jgi:hypothetical protein